MIKTGFLELKHATIDFYMDSINVHTYYDVADPQLNHVETKNIQFCIWYKEFELMSLYNLLSAYNWYTIVGYSIYNVQGVK